MTDNQRWEVLNCISEEFYSADQLVKVIIDGDLELYGKMLGEKSLAKFHLIILPGEPEEQWLDKAILALDKGYSTEAVSNAIFGGIWTMAVSSPARWDEWIDKLEAVKNHQDQRVRDLVNYCYVQVQSGKNKSLEREQKEAIYGFQ